MGFPPICLVLSVMLTPSWLLSGCGSWKKHMAPPSLPEARAAPAPRYAPPAALAHYAMAVEASLGGDHARAMVHLELARKVDPSSLELLLAQAREALHLQDVSLARRLLEEAAPHAAGHPEFERLRAEVVAP